MTGKARNEMKKHPKGCFFICKLKFSAYFASPSGVFVLFVLLSVVLGVDCADMFAACCI